MKSVLRIRIYVVRIRNTGTSNNISIRLINTNEISVADLDPQNCDQDPDPHWFVFLYPDTNLDKHYL
jgi:hypothetical protein